MTEIMGSCETCGEAYELLANDLNDVRCPACNAPSESWTMCESRFDSYSLKTRGSNSPLPYGVSPMGKWDRFN